LPSLGGGLSVNTRLWGKKNLSLGRGDSIAEEKDDPVLVPRTAPDATEREKNGIRPRNRTEKGERPCFFAGEQCAGSDQRVLKCSEERKAKRGRKGRAAVLKKPTHNRKRRQGTGAFRQVWGERADCRSAAGERGPRPVSSLGEGRRRTSFASCERDRLRPTAEEKEGGCVGTTRKPRGGSRRKKGASYLRLQPRLRQGKKKGKPALYPLFERENHVRRIKIERKKVSHGTLDRPRSG